MQLFLKNKKEYIIKIGPFMIQIRKMWITETFWCFLSLLNSFVFRYNITEETNAFQKSFPNSIPASMWLWSITEKCSKTSFCKKRALILILKLFENLF